MLDSWRKEFSELQEYIFKNPKIKISDSVVAIKEDIRPQFYRMFDKAREAFLKEKYQALLDEAAPLSSNYDRSAQEVKKSLGISEIELPSDLNWFLNDPVNGLGRSTYETLFDLLKGRIDIDTFEKEASISIEDSFRQLFRSGYEKWAVLSLVNLLAPEKASVIPIEDIRERCHDPEWDERFGYCEEQLPEITKLRSLSFGRGVEDLFIVANLVVDSSRLKRYVSIGTELADATWTAKEVSKEREWLPMRELGKQFEPIHNWPDIVMYVDDQPQDIALLADFGRFCRPDIIVECMDQVDWYQKGGLDRVRQNYQFLKPKLGSYIVSRFPVPEEAFKDLAGQERQSTAEANPEERPMNIHILTIGYDGPQLSPIIDALQSAIATM